MLTSLPVRRPRRGKQSQAYFEALHDKYHAWGRRFKFSGERRMWSSYLPSHPKFIRLRKPPPPGSMYHKHGNVIARLELLTSLICFTYALWCKDVGKGHCNVNSWISWEPFRDMVKQEWMAGLSD
ncbi:hypothetical protein K474DRAFT_1668713, partial [Panus rudis PR-1116 ss-1]